MSDTPRTDAVEMPVSMKDPSKGPTLVRFGLVETDFARTLERELAAVIKAGNVCVDRCERLERELAEANRALSEGNAERDALKARLAAMFPLFEEARDALTAIPLASAKLHNVRLDLADRMDDVGDPARWAARQEAAK